MVTCQFILQRLQEEVTHCIPYLTWVVCLRSMQGTRNQNSQVIHSSLFCSAIQILIEIVESYKARSVQVYFVRLREQPYSLFKKSKLLDLIGLDHLFSKVSEAIEVIEQDTNKRHMG